jgi:hypothetical protein
MALANLAALVEVGYSTRERACASGLPPAGDALGERAGAGLKYSRRRGRRST